MKLCFRYNFDDKNNYNLSDMYNIMKSYNIEYRIGIVAERICPEFFKLIHVLNENQMKTSICPILLNKHGRWANERNVALFNKAIRKILSDCEENNCHVDLINVIMNSPIKQFESMMNPRSRIQLMFTYIKIATINFNERRFMEAVRHYRSINRFIKSKGINSSVTFLHPVYYDLRFNTILMQNALESPVFSIPWDDYEMAYHSEERKDKLADTNEMFYKMYHELSLMKKIIGEKFGINLSMDYYNFDHDNDFKIFEKEIGVIKACGIDKITFTNVEKYSESQDLIKKIINSATNAEPFIPDTFNDVLKQETKMRRLFKIAKGYYNLYKI